MLARVRDFCAGHLQKSSVRVCCDLQTQSLQVTRQACAMLPSIAVELRVVCKKQRHLVVRRELARQRNACLLAYLRRLRVVDRFAVAQYFR